MATTAAAQAVLDACPNKPAVQPSALMRDAFVATFFDRRCLAANGTGDPCDLHTAEAYTVRKFGSLRFDAQIFAYLGLLLSIALAQAGGIPRVKNWLGAQAWAVWMGVNALQYVSILGGLLMEVGASLAAQSGLEACLVDGGRPLDFYEWTTFAAQPTVVLKIALLFVYSYYDSLGLLVFDGSREWRWLPKKKGGRADVVIVVVSRTS